METRREPAGVLGIESVDILVRRNARDDDALVDLIGKGKLDEDSVDRRVGVELVDEPNQLFLAHGFGQAMLEALHPRFKRRFHLRADVGRRRRMLADEHDSEPRRTSRRLAESRHFARDPLTKREGGGFSVDQLRGHAP